jgi:nucleotide-binding universal stress UspA family protein
VYRKVVVTLDGSPAAEAIIPFILEIARPLGIGVALVQVLEVTPPMAVEGTRYFRAEDLEARRREAEAYLRPVAAKLRARGVDVETVVRHGAPADEIVAAAREVGADLIAMTTHGRSGLGRLLFGSVTESVLRHAELPVFVMRQPATGTPPRVTGEGP